MTYKLTEGCLPIEFLVMGPIQNNVYIIGEGDGLFVVDPTCWPERILEALGGRSPCAIVLTHQHWDHVGAAAALRSETGAPVIAHALDAPYITGELQLEQEHRAFEPCPVDRIVEHGDVVHLGTVPWRVIHTPGHTMGSMCLFVEAAAGSNPDGRPILVAGDTLFAGATGRFDFPESSPRDMREVAVPRLAELPDETIVLPGHNDLTLIEIERKRVFPRFGIMR